MPYLHLDVYEKSLYYHLFRQTRLIGKTDTLFKITSSKTNVGLTESTARERLRQLRDKGCIEIVDTRRDGILVSVRTPREIEGCVVTKSTKAEEIDIDALDFYKDISLRPLILNRENSLCFYCLKRLTLDDFAIDHLIPQVEGGDNTYRNVVAACHECNSAKRDASPDDYLRSLYRHGVLSSEELEDRLATVESLRRGQLKPDL